jgi:hypothetical protein
MSENLEQHWGTILLCWLIRTAAQAEEILKKKGDKYA